MLQTIKYTFYCQISTSLCIYECLVFFGSNVIWNGNWTISLCVTVTSSHRAPSLLSLTRARLWSITNQHLAKPILLHSKCVRHNKHNHNFFIYFTCPCWSAPPLWMWNICWVIVLSTPQYMAKSGLIWKHFLPNVQFLSLKLSTFLLLPKLKFMSVTQVSNNNKR